MWNRLIANQRNSGFLFASAPNAVGNFKWMRLVASLITATGFLGLHTARLRAQAAQEDVPIIDVRYTQILSVDSLNIGGPVAVSPGGRWVVFTHLSGLEESHLWIVSTEGGEPFPITRGPAYDDGPVWFPGGDRIAYRSDGDVLSLAIDPVSGARIGTPRRITLEHSHALFDVSPDGRWIAYTPLN